MDRREQIERADAVDQPSSEPDGAETGGPAGGGTVAQRLRRVTRYANSSRQAEPPAPGDAPDMTDDLAPEVEAPGEAPDLTDNLAPEVEAPDEAPDLTDDPTLPVEAPARQETAPTLAERHEPSPAEEAPCAPLSAEETLEPPAAVMPDSPDGVEDEPALSGAVEEGTAAIAAEAAATPTPFEDTRQETAPAEADFLDALPLDDPPPESWAPEALAEAPAAPPAEPPPEPAALQDLAPPEVPAASPKPPAAPDEAPEVGEKLTVGRGIRLVAKLCECAELLVEGHLEATAQVRHLMIAEGGRFIGSAEADSAEVHGHFEGNLTVAKRLFISATGRVVGTTQYQEIVIEAGGQVMGNAQRLAEHPEAGNGAA